MEDPSATRQQGESMTGKLGAEAKNVEQQKWKLKIQRPIWEKVRGPGFGFEATPSTGKSVGELWHGVNSDFEDNCYQMAVSNTGGNESELKATPRFAFR